MRALELPAFKSIRRGRSPVPLTLAVLVAVLALRAANLGADLVPAHELVAGSIGLADLAPAAGAATPALEAELSLDDAALPLPKPRPLARSDATLRAPATAGDDATPPATPREHTDRLIADILAPATSELANLAPASGSIDLLAPSGPGGVSEPLRAEPFLEERRELARQQEALAVRRIAMDVAEKRLRGHIEELARLRAEIEARLGELAAQDEARTATLVTLYEAMNPKKAALIFDELPFEVLAPLSLAMSERKLAPVVAAMRPNVARRLTAELAEKRYDASLGDVLAAPTSP